MANDTIQATNGTKGQTDKHAARGKLVGAYKATVGAVQAAEKALADAKAAQAPAIEALVAVCGPRIKLGSTLVTFRKLAGNEGWHVREEDLASLPSD